MPSSTNRLLNLFQLELKEAVPPSSANRARAPSHGVSSAISSRPKRTREGVTLERGVFVSPLEHDGEVVDAVARGRTNSRVKTNLERENEQLREQLKFQGAVLDQLSAEVYTLERKAAAGNGGCDGDPGAESKPDDEQDRREWVEEPTCNQPEGGVPGGDGDAHEEPHGNKSVRQESRGALKERGDLRDEPPEHGKNKEDGAGDGGGGAEGDSGTRYAARSAGNRADCRSGEPLGDHTNKGTERVPGAVRGEPGPSEQVGLQALPTGPAGKAKAEDKEPAEGAQLRAELREARTLAEKFRGELSAAQQTAEENNMSHVNLLARERKFRAAIEAGLREKVHIMRSRARDREERLAAELSSVKAQLRETVDLLATKEEEVCLARAHRAQQDKSAAATLAKNKERERHASWLERRLEEVSSAESTAAALRLEEMTAVLEAQQRELESLRASARGTTPTNHQHKQEEIQREVCKTQDGEKSTSAAKEIKCPGHLEGDLEERGPNTSRSSTDFIAGHDFTAGRNDRRADRKSTADGDTDGAKTASEVRRAAAPGAEGGSSPAERARAALPSKGRSTGGSKAADPSAGGDPAPELNCDGADEHSYRSASSKAFPTTMATTTTSTQTPPLGLEGRRKAEASTADPLAGSSQARELLTGEGGGGGGAPLSTNETDLGARRIREEGASCGHKGRRDDTEGEGGMRGTRAVVGAEVELLRTTRRCEEERREWEKEAVCLRVERQEVRRRLRVLGQEAEEKDQAVLELRQALLAMESDLKGCQETRAGLRQELGHHAQARRLLEKRARSAEGLLSDAIAQKTRAERAKVLLKARLTAVTKRKGNGGETRSAGGGRASRQASASRGSNDGCPRCSGLDPGTTISAGKEGIQRGGGCIRETRQAWNEEEKEKPLDAVESSLGGSSTQQQQQQQAWRQEQATRQDLEGPASKSEESGLAEWQGGQRFRGPPGRHHQGKKTGLRRQNLEPEEQQGSKGTLEGQEETGLELQQEVERERREFEAERQRLERERQQSNEAAERAEKRVREVEAAWRALAEKVVALAEHNADLEWVVLKLRRDGAAHGKQESRGGRASSSENNTCEENGRNNANYSEDDDDDGNEHGNKGENSIGGRRNSDTHGDRGAGSEGVPRATLDVEALFTEQEARPMGGERGGGAAVGAEERGSELVMVGGGDDSDEG